MKFSQRYGFKTKKLDLQLDYVDEDLKNSIWNVFQKYILDSITTQFLKESEYYYIFESLWINLFKKPLDTIEELTQYAKQQIRKIYFELDWYEVYDLVEFIAGIELPDYGVDLSEIYNSVLEREMSGYRFIDGVLSKITDKNELNEIENAIKSARKSKYEGTFIHLRSSVIKLSDRKNPDYRNSIKESISAVESCVKQISKDPNAKLTTALNLIQEKVGLHAALKKGFSALYGYTSDEDGIRHAMLELKVCEFEDAKYMLASCSSFINYLIVKAGKAGI